MAAAGAEEIDQSAWEMSKENVQPVRSGRSVNCISTAFQPSKQSKDQLSLEKQKYEEEILAGDNLEDPLDPWDRYLKWTIQNFPSGGSDANLLNLLRKFISKFLSVDQYKNDPRHVAAWLKLAEMISDPLETYSYMNTKGIGTKCAEFYVAWADEYEKYRDFKKCDRIYLDGDEKCAQPREYLQKMHTAFQLRVARAMEEKIKEGESSNAFNPEDANTRTQQRSAFNALRGRGKHHAVGSQRTGRALQSHRNNQGSGLQSLSGSKQPKASAFQIFEEEEDVVHVMGETGQWGSVPSGRAKNENELPAGPWKGVKIKQKHARSELIPSVPAPPMSNFAIFNEEASASEVEGTSTSRKVDSNIEFVLSTKKASRVETNSFSDVVSERPVHESNVVSAYCVDKVYSVMGEMQFEEIRAAHWRKKQRRKKEAEARRLQEEHQRAQEEEKRRMEKLLFEKQQQLEDERRRRDEERLKLMEMERQHLENERKRIMQRQLELKDRPAEVLMREKSVNAFEREQRILKAEEEDVTMQLSKVNQTLKDLRRRSVSGAAAQQEPPASAFAIYDENEDASKKQEREGIPAQTSQATYASLKESSNNLFDQFRPSQPSPTSCTEGEIGKILNPYQHPLSEPRDEAGLSNSSIQRHSSLNNSSFDQSRRSQPSPTVYTKEAMGEVLNWFQKPLLQSHSETCDIDEVSYPHQSQPHSFRPIAQNASQPSTSVPLSTVKQHGGAFAIFSEDDCSSENSEPKQPTGLNNQPALSEVLPSESRGLQLDATEGATAKTMHVADEDKTGSCFDDVTVAGSHFAAKARLASTPFCGRTEKLQNMTDFHQLSCIEPDLDGEEQTENAGSEGREHAAPPSTANCFTEEAAASCEQKTQVEYQTDQYGEIKQLSPIMEASNESEKSSIMRTKSSRSDSESDKTHFPAAHGNTRGEPLGMKSFGASIFQKTSEPAVSPGADDEFLGDAINCDLWGDDEMTQRVSTTDARIANQLVLDRPDGVVPKPSNPSREVAAVDGEVFHNDMLLTEEEDLSLACAKLNLTAAEDQAQTEKGSNPAVKATITTVENPWDEKLQTSIIARSRVFEGGDMDIHFMSGAVIPKLRKGMSLNLGEKSYKVGKLLGKGGYAKVFDTVSPVCLCREVIKFQSPACPWEVYAIAQAKSRLHAKGMHEEANSIIDVVSSHIYDDGSMLVMPYMGNGTLLDMINSKKGTMMKGNFAAGVAYRVLRIVHGLHKVGIIHGDIKPDNFMLDSDTVDFTCVPDDHLDGIKLIDFGRAIDMCEVPPGAAFHLNCGTSGFTCIQMQNKQPWNYHIDFYGIAGTMHVVLLGTYMKVHQDENGMWVIAEKLKRWHDAGLWNDFFSTLLNFPTPTSERPTVLADSPLPRLISKMLDGI